MIRYLAMSLLLGKTAAFSPLRYPVQQSFKTQACRHFAANTSNFHDRYVEFLGKSPYQEKFSDLFKQKFPSKNVV